MFFKVLQQLRKGAKLTQDQLSDALQVQKRTYGSWERGERQPDFETLCRIADYFGVTTDYLLGRTPMTVEVKNETPPPLGENEMQISFSLGDVPKDENELEDMIRREVVRAVSEELNKRGL